MFHPTVRWSWLSLVSALAGWWWWPTVSGYALVDIRQDEKAKYLHRLDSLNLLAYVLLLTLTVCTIWLFKHRRVQFVHETGLAIVYGLVVGAIIRYVGVETQYSHLRVVPDKSIYPNSSALPDDIPPDTLWIKMLVSKENPTSHDLTSSLKENKTYAYVFRGQLSSEKKISQKATFDPEVFFNVLLPPIIFNAGYSLKRRFFFRNLGAIMTYAFIGTTISCFVVGIVIMLFVLVVPSLSSTFSFNDCLYFGAIISATDPVTVLAIFHDLHVDVTLYALVFGESILNDAVAIVLAGAIDSFAGHFKGGGFFPAVGRASGNFMYIFVFSLLQGSAIGCANALLTKMTRLCDFPLLESTIFVLMSYASFLMAEALELSGIVAVLFCGICQAHYTFNNLSEESRVRTKWLFEMLNFIAENFIFIYIGVSMFTFPNHNWNVAFIIGSFIAILVGRALHIYPLTFLLNLGRKNKIPINFQHVLFFSGLRGAMAFALAIRNTLTDARSVMLTSTSLITIVTVMVGGGASKQMLAWFNIPVGVEEADHEMLQISGLRRLQSQNTPTELRTPSLTLDQPIPVRSAYEKAWLFRKWYNFDVLFMKPFLTHARPSLVDTMPACCLPLAKLFTSPQQLNDDYVPHEDSDDDFVLHQHFHNQHERSDLSQQNSVDHLPHDYNGTGHTFTLQQPTPRTKSGFATGHGNSASNVNVNVHVNNNHVNSDSGDVLSTDKHVDDGFI